MSGETVVVSSDERREVAARLRKQAEKLGPNMDAHEFANYTADVLDVGESMMWYGMELRLADLIEPEPERTARLEYDDMHGCNICTGCGERYEHGMYMAVTYDDFIAYKPMRYCPACGARLEGVGR